MRQNNIRAKRAEWQKGKRAKGQKGKKGKGKKGKKYKKGKKGKREKRAKAQTNIFPMILLALRARHSPGISKGLAPFTYTLARYPNSFKVLWCM